MTSRVIIPTDGSTRLFTVPFPFLDRNHVRVAINRVLQFPGRDYEWVGPQQIEFREPPQGGFEIFRQTPDDDAMVSFRNGAALTETELNLAVLQNLYLVQELKDYYEALINGALDRLVIDSGNDNAGPVIDRVVQEVLESELLAELRQRIVDIDTNANTINTQRIELDELRTVMDEWLQSVDIGTIITEERTERIEGDTALAEILSMIGAVSGDSSSFIMDLDRVHVTPTESMGMRLSLLEASIGDNTTLIAEERTTRIDELAAMSQLLLNLESSFNESNALITETLQTLASEDEALANRIDGMLVEMEESVTALLLEERTAWVAADAAISSLVQTLQNQVGDNTAALQVQAEVIDGLEAQYTVKIDNNGVLSGFGLTSGPSGPDGVIFSEFLIHADRFAFVTPGSTPKVPFAADANGVYMDEAFIRHLTVDKISGGAINDIWSMNQGGGRIVLDTGTHMKVIGVGFGAGGDLVEWYGPKMSITACSKANGITWTDMRGNAYWGGNLKAGTLYNAARTTNTAGDAEVVLGPFDTNGGSKSVVLSYSFSKLDTSTATGNSGYSYTGGTPVATIRLYRTVNNGPEVLIATLPFTGSYDIHNEFDAPDTASQVIGGSHTYTDNTGASQITYRAVISGRSLAQFSHPNETQHVHVEQSLGIVSTEQ